MAGTVVDKCWIRSDYLFNLRGVIFTVHHREAMASQIKSLLTRFNDKPEDIEREVIALIETHHPELKGGQLMRIATTWASWELWYLHPSLPECKEGMLPHKASLIPSPNEVKDPLVDDFIQLSNKPK